MPGIYGVSRFIVNSEGIRGDEFSDNQQYHILTTGGSTTECLLLDQTETWPFLLQKKLNNLKVLNVWVGNVGKSGTNTRDHLLQLRCLLSQYQKIDAVIMLIGINDLALRLKRGKNYNPNFINMNGFKNYRFRRAFSILPYRTGKNFIEKMAIWHFVSRVKMPSNDVAGMIQDETGKIYITWREQRKHASKLINKLPDLTSSLDEYSRNINAIIDIAKSKSVRIVFLTQPAMWRQYMTDREKELLWFGHIGRMGSDRYYSIEALKSGLERYNDQLIEICKLRGIEFINLANLIPKDTTVFYDDVHFNENGAKMVSDAIIGYLTQREPFSNTD